jgi:hypothetical protein
MQVKYNRSRWLELNLKFFRCDAGNVITELKPSFQQFNVLFSLCGVGGFSRFVAYEYVLVVVYVLFCV